jgi:hypothetical protein
MTMMAITQAKMGRFIKKRGMKSLLQERTEAVYLAV